MTTYADPTRCPDCRALLPHDPSFCRVCALPLTGDTVVTLFTTLQEADRLLGVLRAQRRPVPATTGAPAPTASGGLLAGVESYPAPGPRPAENLDAPRLSGLSVPRILLSLGALCLLVAAVTFLTFAWSWLGVGGRTVVLVALTAASLGLSVGLVKRGLRTAAEALSVVGLGLLTLDVIGLRHAGWLGAIDDERLTLVTGAVVATGALLNLLATSRRPLVTPAVVAPLALFAAGAGLQDDHRNPAAMALTTLLLLGLGRVGTELPSRTLRITALATAALSWLVVVTVGTDLAGDPFTLAHVVGDGAGWPFLVATAIAALAGPITGMRREVTLAGYSLAGLVGTYGVLLPVLDNARTAMVAGLLVAGTVWVLVLVTAPRDLRPAAVLPALGTLVVPLTALVALAGDAGRAVTTVGAPFTRDADVHVVTSTSWVSPLLLVPSLLALAAAACAITALLRPVGRRAWTFVLATAAGLGVMATVPLYDVPLAAVGGLLAAAAVAAVVLAERLPETLAAAARLAALALAAGATLLALPSDALTTGVLLVACALSGWQMIRTNAAGAVAAVCFPFAFALLFWAAGSTLAVDEQLRAVPVLLVLGGLAVWRPQLELEAASAVAGALSSAAAIGFAQDLDLALAVHLTLAGMLVTASSLVHPSRRALAWPGGLLLAAATWVRLAELGVHVPEAYTLPSALVLVVVGGLRLRQDDRTATLTFLAPGLSLATVPSLVAILDDPSSLRALLLGIACLVLTCGGAMLRWGAPLVVGAVVGSLLVLRELAPYAAYVPTWLTIGVSGAVLLVVGITWESRMNDVRRASRYVAALR